MQDPFSFPMDEQESGSYLATITDDLGVMLPGATLLTLALTLYVIKTDGTEQIVNSRDAQDVLNVNQVQVFDTLQALSDGRTYNLRWRVQPADSTLVEQLPFERHIGLFEWTWGAGAGKHEMILVIKNLHQVP
jgi:hypothetical protein